MAQLVYALCGVTGLACAGLLFRAYVSSRRRMLFWSGLCFVGLTVSNLLVLLDRVVFLEKDLSTARLATALVSLALLLYGLIWEED